jgi:hypothetical protein
MLSPPDWDKIPYCGLLAGINFAGIPKRNPATISPPVIAQGFELIEFLKARTKVPEQSMQVQKTFMPSCPRKPAQKPATTRAVNNVTAVNAKSFLIFTFRGVGELRYLMSTDLHHQDLTHVKVHVTARQILRVQTNNRHE